MLAKLSRRADGNEIFLLNWTFRVKGGCEFRKSIPCLNVNAKPLTLSKYCVDGVMGT